MKLNEVIEVNPKIGKKTIKRKKNPIKPVDASKPPLDKQDNQ